MSVSAKAFEKAINESGIAKIKWWKDWDKTDWNGRKAGLLRVEILRVCYFIIMVVLLLSLPNRKTIRTAPRTTMGLNS